jgi:CheY-like chemotaxis protein
MEGALMGARILVLDDEPWQLSWITDVAKAFGGNATFAVTYDDAVKLFDKAKPDIAVVDIRIGDVDGAVQGATLQGADASWTGLRFLRFIRVERGANDVIVFVYTGLDRDELQKIVEGAYRGQFFTKFESSYFAEALKQTLKKYKAKQR